MNVSLISFMEFPKTILYFLVYPLKLDLESIRHIQILNHENFIEFIVMGSLIILNKVQVNFQHFQVNCLSYKPLHPSQCSHYLLVNFRRLHALLSNFLIIFSFVIVQFNHVNFILLLLNVMEFLLLYKF